MAVKACCQPVDELQVYSYGVEGEGEGVLERLSGPWSKVPLRTGVVEKSDSSQS